MKAGRIAPSILAADFARLGDEIAAVADHVDLLHIDVMDGHFVPNISLGMPVIASIRDVTSLRFDCHLMTTNPGAYFEQLRQAGADLVTVHLEVFPDPAEAAQLARRSGLEFGLAVNPATPIEGVDPFVELCDMILVMLVNPGFGGQELIPDVLPKIEWMRKVIDSRALPTDIEVDGGIGPDNIAMVREAGADVFVAGSSVFGAPDPVAAVDAMRSAIKESDSG